MSTTIEDEIPEQLEPSLPTPGPNGQNGGDEISGGIVYRIAETVPRRTWRTWLIGRHLATEDMPHQTIGKAVGLAVFSPVAPFSTAYSPPENLPPHPAGAAPPPVLPPPPFPPLILSVRTIL